MQGDNRLTYDQLTAVLRALQYVDLDIFADGRDRKSFRQANAKLVRLWNQARLEKQLELLDAAWRRSTTKKED
jgi:hypothetical protein